MNATETPTYRPFSIGDHQGSVFTARIEDDLKSFKRTLETKGYVKAEDTLTPRPWNHRVIGVGVGHDDADFAEIGRSMAAYYENGEAFDGKRWWDDDAFARHYWEAAEVWR